MKGEEENLDYLEYFLQIIKNMGDVGLFQEWKSWHGINRIEPSGYVEPVLRLYSG